MNRKRSIALRDAPLFYWPFYFLLYIKCLPLPKRPDYIYLDINTQQQSSQKWQHLEDAGNDETGNRML